MSTKRDKSFRNLSVVGGNLGIWKKLGAGRSHRRRSSLRSTALPALSLDWRALVIEGLEPRIVPASIVWNNTAAPTGGDWDVASNWVGGVVPKSTDSVTIALASAGTVSIVSGGNDAAASLITNGNSALKILNGSLALGVGTASSLAGAVTVGFGSTLSVGIGSTLVIGGSLTDNGTVSFSNGDTVSISFQQQLLISGTLTSVGTTFTGSGVLIVNGGGVITPTSSTFNVPLTVPYTDIASLTSNVSFGTINIQPGTLPSGSTLALNQIGVNTANLNYVFTGGFTVASGATVNVGPNVSVVIASQLTDNGTINFSSGDIVTVNFQQSIVVANSLTSSGTTFTGSGVVTVNPGGLISPTGSTFGVQLFVPYTNISALGSNVSFGTINIAGGTLPNGSTLTLNAIGLNTSNLSYVFSGAFTVDTQATLNVGPSVNVTVAQQLAVNGTANFSPGDIVNINFQQQILVAGTLTSSGTTFTASGVITVNPGAVITPTASTFNVPINLPYNNIASLTPNISFKAINITGGTLPNGSTLTLNAIGLNTSNLSYVFTSGFVVAAGATITVGPNVNVVIANSLTDNGTVNFSSGDIVNINFQQSIIVASVLNATGMSFTGSGSLVVNSGGTLTPTGTTFGVPLFVPYTNVALLTPNISFGDINIAGGTLPSGTTLALNPIGLNTSSLNYIINGVFTIASGAIVNVGPGVPLVVANNLTVDGTLSLSNGDNLTINFQRFVTVDGTLTAKGTSFTGSGTLNVNSPGVFTFNSGNLLVQTNLGTNTSNTIKASKVTTGLGLSSGSTVDIHGNDLSAIGSKGIVATGDPAASIDLSGNYWATTNTATIAAKILDHVTDVSRPTVVFAPIVSGTGATQATSTSVTYSPVAQTVTLTAVVTSSGTPVTGGTETFTILQGGNVIGSPVTASVLSGAASQNYTLPAGTPVGKYTIQAVYSGSASYLGFTDTSQTLTVNQASVTLNPSSTSMTYDGVATTTISLNASVTSAAGTVSEGSITYTVLQGSTPVGTAKTVSVINGLAPASYDIPGGTAGGSYTIQASFTATNFASGLNTAAKLFINAASTTTATTSTSTTYNSALQSIALSATVSSSAGNVNEGFATFSVQTLGGSPINSSVTVAVKNGVANANYPLLAGQTGGLYKIVVTFNSTANYLSSSDNTKQLTINGAAAATAPNPATTTYSGVAGTTVPLTATVTSLAGIINEGTETFTILLGGQIYGSPQTVNVINGVANVGYLIPVGTVGGTYTIQAVYNGTVNYSSVVNSSQTLIINASTSISVASSITTVFNGAAGQTVPLTVNVTSTAAVGGLINEGFETFVVKFGSVTIGTPVTVSVVNGVATGNYFLPQGTGGGVYVIQATYNGTVNYSSSVDITRTITINAAVSSTSSTSTSLTFAPGGQTVNLNATVTSAFGTVNEGTETFTVLSNGVAVSAPLTVAVVNGLAVTPYSLPVDLGAGIYVIQAVYNGTLNYKSVTDVSHTITINVAAAITVASSTTVTYASGAQSVTLNAKVNSAVGIVNEGTETFTILLGNTVYGQPVTVNVVNGVAVKAYPLPAGLPVGTYTIHAVYNGTGHYSTTTDSTQTLVINIASSLTVAVNETIAFNAAVAQVVDLHVNVTSPTGTVNEGQETFTVYLGQTLIGQPVTVNVVNGVAIAHYTLPVGSAGGTYQLVETFSGTGNFTASSDTNKTLFISAAVVTTVTSSLSVSFSANSQQIPVSATITSAAGIVNEGSATFAILLGNQVIVQPVSAVVINGIASATITIPGGLAGNSYIVQAIYLGTNNFAPAADTSQKLQVTKSLVSIAITPATLTVPKGLTDQFTATGTYNDGSTVDVTNLVTWASTDASIITISNATGTKGLATGVTQGPIVPIVAVLGELRVTTTVTVLDPIVVSIDVTATSSSIAKGLTDQFTATGKYSDGTSKNLTQLVTWSSADTSIATISNTIGSIGLASTLKTTASVAIKATFAGVTGLTSLVITPAALVSIAFTQANATPLPKGLNTQLSISGTYTDATVVAITSQILWASSTTSVATVSQTGFVTGVTLGTTTITATVGTVTQTIVITVSAPVLTSFVITPASSSIAKGLTLNFKAQGTFSDNSKSDVTSLANWSSANGAVLVVIASSGFAGASSVGQTTVTAKIGNISATTAFTVTPATLVSISVAPNGPSILAGQTQQFHATGLFTDSTQVNMDSSVSWTSSNTAAGTVNSLGLATGVAIGSTTITAKSGNLTASTPLNVAFPLNFLTTPTTTKSGKAITSITVTFNEALDATSALTTGVFTLLGAGSGTKFTTPIIYTVSYVPGSTTLKFTLTKAFTGTIQIKTSALKAANGTAVVGTILTIAK